MLLKLNVHVPATSLDQVIFFTCSKSGCPRPAPHIMVAKNIKTLDLTSHSSPSSTTLCLVAKQENTQFVAKMATSGGIFAPIAFRAFR